MSNFPFPPMDNEEDHPMPLPGGNMNKPPRPPKAPPVAGEMPDEAKGRYSNSQVVEHLKGIKEHCDTPLMRATHEAVLDAFQTREKMDNYGPGMKFMDNLHELALEVTQAESELGDPSDNNIRKVHERRNSYRSSLFGLHGEDAPPLIEPNYSRPLDRLGEIHFQKQTYTSDEFYKIIEGITNDLYSGDDNKLIILRNQHAKEILVNDLKIDEFESAAKRIHILKKQVEDGTQYHQLHNKLKEQLKQIENDIRDLEAK